MSWTWPWSPRDEEKILLFKTLEAVMTAAAAQSRAAEAQARAVEAHLALFKTTDPPHGWTNRDEDEYMAELERKGFPRHGTQAEQAKWVLDNTGEGVGEWEARAVQE